MVRCHMFSNDILNILLRIMAVNKVYLTSYSKDAYIVTLLAVTILLRTQSRIHYKTGVYCMQIQTVTN